MINRVHERPPKLLPTHFAAVAMFKVELITETEGIGSEKMDVYLSGNAMGIVLKMVMFQIGQRMRHVLFTALDIMMPDFVAIPADFDMSGQG